MSQPLIDPVNIDQVKLVEVGPRDGLQNESTLIASDIKIELIDRLSQSGLAHIESASFVSAKWVPQMADAAQVIAGIKQRQNTTYSALTPNLKGFEAALEAGVKEVAIFTAASNLFCQHNINCNIAQSLQRFEPILALAQQEQIKVRGYVSTVLGCPYQGKVALPEVASISRELLDMGCYEISLGDTIGIGTPYQAKAMIETLAKNIAMAKLAVHFHDSYGQALANIYACIEQGVRTVDSSIAGLGGCPYARGASGNVATEDVLYLLQGLALAPEIDLQHLIATGNWISGILGRKNQSKVALALSQ